MVAKVPPVRGAAEPAEMVLSTSVLMCPPDYYAIEYEINPWMDRRRNADRERAQGQGEELLLEELVPEKIAVTPEDALNFACNAVVAQGNVVLNTGCTRFPEELEGRGFAVYQLDLSEFLKAGGSAKCLTLRLNGWPR